MTAPDTPFSFLYGLAVAPTRAIVISSIDELADAGEPDTDIFERNPREPDWREVAELEWTATKACALPEKSGSRIVAIGPAGNVIEDGDGGQAESTIDSSDRGPNLHGVIRDVREIGGTAYACGMGRQVYRRERTGTWVHDDHGAIRDPNPAEVVGFNAIDGWTSKEVYAAGFGGEIWRCLDGNWGPLTSPTNVILNDVLATESCVYICGQGGILLQVRDGNIQAIDHSIDAELWSMAHFQGQLYVASDEALYTVSKEEDLTPVEFDLDGDFTFGSVSAIPGTACVGRKEARTRDLRRSRMD